MKETKSVKALKKQLGAAVAMVCVSAIALGTSTYAWFVSNTKVAATSSSVSATSATPNLLIVKGTKENGEALTSNGKTSETITSTAATALYPASTDDCTTWWAVKGWESNGTTTLANAYYNPTIAEKENGISVKDGAYKQGSTDLNAYQVSTYSVYTTAGEVELNLDPTNPISVTVDGNTADAGTGFKDALRVGIVVDGTLKLVYAPTEETGTGNDRDAQTGYRTVDNASATKAATYSHVEANTFTDWTAEANTDKTNADGTYKKAKNSLGTVGTNGSVVQIYVWLEGTDADCLVGKADSASDADSYKVSLNFVGATVDVPQN